MRFSNLKYHQDGAIKKFVQDCDKMITAEEKSVMLGSNHIMALKQSFIQKLILQKKLSITELTKLNDTQIKYLRDPDIQKFILNNRLSVQKFISLTPLELDFLAISTIKDLLSNTAITIQQLNKFLEREDDFKQMLLNPHIISMLYKNYISIDQLLALNKDQAKFLMLPEIREFFYNNDINIEEFLKITDIQHLQLLQNVLISPNIQRLITEEVITIKDIIESSKDFLLALIKESGVRRLIISGKEPIKELIKLSYSELQEKIVVSDRKAERQNTHTRSVHESASESAKHLFNRYRTELESRELLQQHINSIKKSILSSTTNTELQKKAALECVDRLVAIDNEYLDVTSGVSLKELLIIAHLAILDENTRQGDFKDALNMFIEGLFEIQSGIDLDDKTIDQETMSYHPICLSGSFNKLIEKLASIDPDCEIKYITSTNTTEALQSVVIEITKRYLQGKLDNICTLEDVKKLKKILNTIRKEQCIACIYEEIKDEVKSTIKKINAAYKDEDISNGEYVQLPVELLKSLNLQLSSRNLDTLAYSQDFRLTNTSANNKEFLEKQVKHPRLKIESRTRPDQTRPDQTRPLYQKNLNFYK